MSEPVIGLLGIVVLLILIFLRMPIGFAMALVGFGGFAVLSGIEGALSNLSSVPFRYVADYNFVVIPLFLLMGTLAANAGISRDLYRSANSWVGQIRGGLAMASIAAAGGFSAICGSSTATAVAMAKVAFPEMRRYNYDERLATGSLAAGGTLGILIPPSMGFIMYAILTEASVGQLFIAGIIPGVTQVIFYILAIYVVCLMDVKMGPPGPRTGLKEKILSLRGTWSMLALFALVMGGIYLGWFTPSEAAAIGAFGALIISIAMRRLNFKIFGDSLAETGSTTAMVLLLIIGSMIFARFLAVSKLPFVLAELVANLNVPALLVLAGILLFYIAIGCFLEIYSSVVLTIPIIFPTIMALGFDPIWFGVLVVRVCEIGLLTPPIGMNVFVIAGSTGVPTGKVFRGILPFFISDLLHISLLVAIPGISLFLVKMMMK
ncbi:MAG: TRAP transporter large permease [Dehalococcoidales bacterium]|jgi:tripartite ATP-independent transporter DctM subunit|nr:TRAP transporter large permease [Dehalococcoidales bacterium]